ncbi:hypothetical protein EVAR_64271_1 [Eumeta japonica]|uniref:Uncharacterized protein n=1 Tax=Eumeta variegata TaxID=151549 RepID=A0A4C2ABJ1_EUMVA|nr:hypothetical protein EVAR_64271_1 [Eumeta japonica]
MNNSERNPIHKSGCPNGRALASEPRRQKAAIGETQPHTGTTTAHRSHVATDMYLDAVPPRRQLRAGRGRGAGGGRAIRLRKYNDIKFSSGATHSVNLGAALWVFVSSSCSIALIATERVRDSVLVGFSTLPCELPESALSQRGLSRRADVTGSGRGERCGY